MANSTVKVFTPKSVTITAASAAALDTAVVAQVNTLMQTQLNPKNTGAAVGDVQNGSVIITQAQALITTGNVVTWFANVMWNQWVIPT